MRDLRYYQLGPGVVQISWQPPEQPNGIINGYELTYQLQSKGMCSGTAEGRQIINIESGSTTQYQLEGVPPHSRYMITVAARTNTVGPPERIEVMNCLLKSRNNQTNVR